MNSVHTQQALNQMLEALGLPSKQLTERDFLESSCHVALVFLADNRVEEAKEELRKVLS